MAQESLQKYLAVKAEHAKPTIVGVITVGGVRKEFRDFISFFLARAFYSKMGVAVLAVHSGYTPSVGEYVAPNVVLAKAA
jgi:hypothetical protein